jgi:hypothetical protein
MSEKTFTNPTALHFSFATQLRLPSLQLEQLDITGPVDEVIDPRCPVSTDPSSDVVEQHYVCNHICKAFKQFSYSIPCWARVVSVSSHEDGQIVQQRIDGGLTDNTASREPHYQIQETAFFAIIPTQKAGTLGAFSARKLGSAVMAPASLSYRFNKEKAYPSPLPLDASVFLAKTTADPGSAQ